MLNTIPFTSVHSNLEHGLAILTENFSPAQICLTQPLLLKSKAEVCAKPRNTLFISCTLKLDQTGSHWPQLVPINQNYGCRAC